MTHEIWHLTKCHVPSSNGWGWGWGWGKEYLTDCDFFSFQNIGNMIFWDRGCFSTFFCITSLKYSNTGNFWLCIFDPAFRVTKEKYIWSIFFSLEALTQNVCIFWFYSSFCYLISGPGSSLSSCINPTWAFYSKKDGNDNITKEPILIKIWSYYPISG